MWIRGFGLVVSIVALTGCQTTWEDKTSSYICEAFEVWMNAGPRALTGDRRISLPDAYYVETEPDVILLTSFAWNYNCPEDVLCEDESDVVFKDVLRRPAHSLSGYGYYTMLESCLTNKSPSDRYSDLSDKKLSQTKEFRTAKVALQWMPEELTSEVIVTYKQKNK